MVIIRTIVVFLTFTISSVFTDDYDKKVTAYTLKDQFEELQRLEKNSKDFSYQNLATIERKLKGLMTISCNYELENVNLTLSEIYQNFQNQERKILQNTQEIKVMKEVLKDLAKMLPYTFEEKADKGIKSINKVEFKQKEMLPTSFQLENSTNRSQFVQPVPQTVRYSSNTKVTIVPTTTRLTNFRNTNILENDLSGNVPDCQTPPLPSTYCHHYRILWYYSSKEGRCNRFRKGCEETFRNSYKSERECRDICVGPGFEERRACFLPRSPGICNGVERKWYFDWKENRCKDFIYKGCLGNQNRFPDEKTCWQQCGSITSQSAVEQGSKGNKSEYKRKQIDNFIDNEHETKIPKHSAYSKAHLPDKDVHDNHNYETNNYIQVASVVKENDGHYPEYVPFKNQLLPLSNAEKKSLSDQNNYIPTPSSVNRYMVNSTEYNKTKLRKTKSGNHKHQGWNTIQSTLPNYERNKEKSAQTYDDIERNDEENQQMKMKSNQQKFESLENTYFGTNYLDKIAISHQRTGQDYDPNFAKVNEKKTIFKGGYRNRKRKSRQYLYLYNDHHKRRSKVSKTKNLRVELHAPKHIGVGDTFKLKCIVGGSLAEAVDIIWDKDDASDEKPGDEWKKKERTNINKFSNKKTSTLYVPGIYSSVRFTCLVSCYNPQTASMLPTKLKEKEKVERVESYLCAFDSVKLKPSDGF